MLGLVVLGASGHFQHMGPRAFVHQLRLRPKVAACVLNLHQFLHAGVAGQQRFRQVQQLAHARVEDAHAVVSVEHQNALADAGQRALQQLGVHGKLLVERQQFGLRPFALGNIGVRADHAQGLAGGAAAHHHAARQNPGVVIVFAAQANVRGVAGRFTVQIIAYGLVQPGQVVGVHAAAEFDVALAQLPSGIAQHFLPASGVGLFPGHQVPVPNAGV